MLGPSDVADPGWERVSVGESLAGGSSTDAANAAFWDELCGSLLARSVGVTDHSPDSLARFDAAYFEMYPYLLPLVDQLDLSDARVLEIGLGYGSLGQRLAERASEYHAIDIAAAPVGLMGDRLAILGRPNLARQGSALALPYPDRMFDAVVSIGTLHHTGDLAGAIAEVRRVLRPGGQALLMVYNRWALRRLLWIPRIRLAALIGRTGGYRDAGERIRALYDASVEGEAAPATEFASPLEMRRLLRGFRSAHIELHNMDYYRRIRRERLLGNVDRLVGLDIYALARR